MLDEKEIKKLPNALGVYFFLKNKKPIYIGKAVNIKARVLSHQQNSLYNKKEKLIFERADEIKYILTESDFNSLLLEAKLIKKYQPLYNVRHKDDKTPLYISINFKEIYPKVLICRKSEIKKDSMIFGPFSSQKIVKNLIRQLRKIVPFCTQKKSLRPCFYSKIGMCHPCPGYIIGIKNEETKNLLTKKYQKNINQLIKILNGKFNSFLVELKKQLNRLIKEKKYEEAIVIRNKLRHFKYLVNRQFYEEEKNHSQIWHQSLAEIGQLFLKNDKIPKRIEGYDLSNLGEKIVVGAMVCFTNGYPSKSEYRRFKIKIKKNLSDSQKMVEILQRRFKNNWTKPDLIIIDGGRPQLRAINKFLENNRLKIPVVGIAKNPDRVIFGSNLKTVYLPLTSHAFHFIQQIRDEVHRFAKKYYLTLSKKYYRDSFLR